MSKKGWLEYEVAEADAGLTVESIVREKLHVSGRMLQRLTRSKGVLLNRKPPFLKRVVKAGDKVAVRVQDQPGQDASPQQAAQRKQGKSVEAALPVEILYEDEHLLVANKPAGMMVHPVKQDQQGTLVHALAEYLREKGEPDRVHPVHRLDKETSGAILVGKTSYGHQLADRLLRDGSLHREYLAVVCGRLEEANGTISAPIGRDPRHPTRRKVTERGRRLSPITSWRPFLRIPVLSGYGWRPGERIKSAFIFATSGIRLQETACMAAEGTCSGVRPSMPASFPFRIRLPGRRSFARRRYQMT